MKTETVYLKKQNRLLMAYTLIDVFALLFVVFATIFVRRLIGTKYGVFAGTGAGVLTAALCVIVLVTLYGAKGRRTERERRELREKYRKIYRVIDIPMDQAVTKKAQDAEIRVGDYGWEAVPLRNDGLIYLQGLNQKWRVVWYSGFRPDQIEAVSLKPQSQYDWKYSWVHNPPPCPYPVQERRTNTMGLPPITGNWGHA